MLSTKSLINNELQRVLKTPLPLDKYDLYNIDQRMLAYTIEISNISLKTADEIEQTFEEQGYKVCNVELIRHKSAAGNFFKLKLIIAKRDFLF